MFSTKTLIKRSISSPLICRICGDIARGMNFDVITCVSCKAFFRRNAFLITSRHRHCERKNSCDITKETRTSCVVCRLRKCYRFGMNPQLIRSIKSIPSFRKENNHLKLTVDQWNFLFSTVFQSYDEEYILIQTRNLLNEKRILPLKCRMKSLNILNLLEQSLAPIQLLIEHSPYFQFLNNDAQKLLIEHNLFFSSTLNSLFVIKQIGALENPTFLDGCSYIYGYDLINKYIQLSSKIETNEYLIKLMSITLLYSSNCSVVLFNSNENISIISTSLDLLHIQNIYINLFWKYLLYLSGSNQSILRFSSFIQLILQMIHFSSLIPQTPIRQLLINRIIKQFQ